MKQFVLLILIVCLVINDESVILAKPENVSKCKEDPKDIHNALESLLKVGVKKLKQPINEEYVVNGSVYETEQKKLLFVKQNSTVGSDKMFHGEFESLNAIRNTKTVLAPRPIATGHTKKKNNFLVLEYLNLTSFENKSSAELGNQLADMHLYNLRGKQPAIKQFGFHVDTNCGSIPQNNSWADDWVTFFIENRLYHQIKMLNPKNTSVQSVVIRYYWKELKPALPYFFEGVDIKPSLLHGNLRDENVGRLGSKPVLFNPSSFYGHHEYDIATIKYSGNFSSEFFDAYHKKIPKAQGFDRRIRLYSLFHLINEWNQGLDEDGFTLIDIIDELSEEFYVTTTEKS